MRKAVAGGCEVAGAMLQPPQARAVLPTIALEHSASLPHQAATWRATLKVRPAHTRLRTFWQLQAFS